MIVFHLMSFDDITTYRLEFPEGRFTGEWRLVDSEGQTVKDVTGFELGSDRLSENHDIVINKKGCDLILAVIGVEHTTRTG